MAMLQDYIIDTSALLRDSNLQFTTRANLIRYINLSRREIAKRSACLQALVTGQAPFGTGAQPGYMIPGAFVPGMLPDSLANNQNEPGAISTTSNLFTTIPGVELYTYNYANPFLQKQYAGYDKVIYVFNIAVSWGGQMPVLDWMPWDNLQAYARAVNLGVSSYPQAWSQKGLGENGQVFMYPIPTNLNSSIMEWDCVCTPKSLYTNDDMEALPEIYQGCVKYYAAYLAFLGQQRTGQAEIMRGLFDEQIQISGVASDWGHVESYYRGFP